MKRRRFGDQAKSLKMELFLNLSEACFDERQGSAIAALTPELKPKNLNQSSKNWLEKLFVVNESGATTCKEGFSDLDQVIKNRVFTMCCKHRAVDKVSFLWKEGHVDKDLEINKDLVKSLSKALMKEGFEKRRSPESLQIFSDAIVIADLFGKSKDFDEVRVRYLIAYNSHYSKYDDSKFFIELEKVVDNTLKSECFKIFLNSANLDWEQGEAPYIGGSRSSRGEQGALPQSANLFLQNPYDNMFPEVSGLDLLACSLRESNFSFEDDTFPSATASVENFGGGGAASVGNLEPPSGQ